MNEIFISDAKEARLLSHFISSHISSRICLSPALLLLFTLSSSFFLSDIYCNSLLLISPCISLLAPSLSLPSPSFLNSAPWWRSGSVFFLSPWLFLSCLFAPGENRKLQTNNFFFFFNTPTTSNYLCSRMPNRNSLCVFQLI